MQEYKAVLGDSFEIITAFSRDGPKKVYVQHRLKEHAKEINELLQKKAYFYVCGDASHMAREVNTVLAEIIAEFRGVSEQKAEDVVKAMRSANQYQVCFKFLHVWVWRARLAVSHTSGCGLGYARYAARHQARPDARARLGNAYGLVRSFSTQIF